MKYEMPALNDEQRNIQIERCRAIIDMAARKIINEYDEADVINAQIALAALTVEPNAYKWEGKKTGKTCFDGIKPLAVTSYPLYTAPPVPVLKLPGITELINISEYLPAVRDVTLWDACISEVKRLNGVK